MTDAPWQGLAEDTLDEELQELESAEDFLDYFAVPYDHAVVHVSRLHILQRFHDYLASGVPQPEDPAERRDYYRELLARAYGDFVASNAQREKVFRVFRDQERQQGFVSVEELLGKK